jgi:putative ABC transport system permease protein
MIFFVYALFIFNPSIRKGVFLDLAMLAITAAEMIMYVFSFFFVLYSVSSFLKTRKREFGIFILHGMTKQQLNKMVFVENMLIGFGATMTGIGAGVLTGKLFLMAGSHFLGVRQLPFYLSWKALALTVGAFTLLFLLISICASARMQTDELAGLLQSSQKPKPEPKASAPLSLLAAVLLLASYGLAATATAGTVYIRMLPVIAMTIAGTYFFYTQLGVFLTKLMKRNRTFFLNRTNIVTLSGLVYRIKDNARMFFMVTIVSTVAFCAVGAFASLNAFTSSLRAEHPAAIGYVAKDGSTAWRHHLDQIRGELEANGIAYRTLSFPIKYADSAVLSPVAAGPLLLPLISFADYKQAVVAAGGAFDEQPLSGNSALVLLSSERDRIEIAGREYAVYTLRDEGLMLWEIGYTRHVALQDDLLNDFDRNFDFDALVVSDEVFDQVLSPARTDTYTGFYTAPGDFGRTAGLASALAENGRTAYDAGKPYSLVVGGTVVAGQKSLFNTMFFIAILVGTVFFIAAGSFLYFRLYADLDYDRRQYETIAKLGLTVPELNRIVTTQMALLFFVPIVFAMVHSIFAFKALQSFFHLSIATDMAYVLLGFLIAQVMYFLFIRSRYLRNLRKTLA